MKLTKAQRRSLEGLARAKRCDDRSAHAYEVSLAACRGLAAAGLATLVDTTFNRHPGCRWRAEITAAGRAALESA